MSVFTFFSIIIYLRQDGVYHLSQVIKVPQLLYTFPPLSLSISILYFFNFPSTIMFTLNAVSLSHFILFHFVFPSFTTLIFYPISLSLFYPVLFSLLIHYHSHFQQSLRTFTFNLLSLSPSILYYLMHPRANQLVRQFMVV